MNTGMLHTFIPNDFFYCKDISCIQLFAIVRMCVKDKAWERARTRKYAASVSVHTLPVQTSSFIKSKQKAFIVEDMGILW